MKWFFYFQVQTNDLSIKTGGIYEIKQFLIAISFHLRVATLATLRRVEIVLGMILTEEFASPVFPENTGVSSFVFFLAGTSYLRKLAASKAYGLDDCFHLCPFLCTQILF